jgi:hypothetical protein
LQQNVKNKSENLDKIEFTLNKNECIEKDADSSVYHQYFFYYTSTGDHKCQRNSDIPWQGDNNRISFKLNNGETEFNEKITLGKIISGSKENIKIGTQDKNLDGNPIILDDYVLNLLFDTDITLTIFDAHPDIRDIIKDIPKTFTISRLVGLVGSVRSAFGDTSINITRVLTMLEEMGFLQSDYVRGGKLKNKRKKSHKKRKAKRKSRKNRR